MKKKKILKALYILKNSNLIDESVFKTLLSKVDNAIGEETKNTVSNLVSAIKEIKKDPVKSVGTIVNEVPKAVQIVKSKNIEIRHAIEKTVNKNVKGVNLKDQIKKNKDLNEEEKKKLLQAVELGNIEAHNDIIPIAKVNDAEIKTILSKIDTSKVVSDEDKNKLITQLVNKIYGLIKNTDLSKFFNIDLKQILEDNKIEIKFKKRKDEVIDKINQYESKTVQELINIYNSFKGEYDKLVKENKGYQSLVSVKRIRMVLSILIKKTLLSEKEKWLKINKEFASKYKKLADIFYKKKS